jgi:hypothetical protein
LSRSDYDRVICIRHKQVLSDAATQTIRSFSASVSSLCSLSIEVPKMTNIRNDLEATSFLKQNRILLLQFWTFAESLRGDLCPEEATGLSPGLNVI